MAGLAHAAFDFSNLFTTSRNCATQYIFLLMCALSTNKSLLTSPLSDRGVRIRTLVNSTLLPYLVLSV